MSLSPYQFAIKNIAEHIMSPENQELLHKEDTEEGLIINAFSASEMLGIAFMKPKGKVLFDIINAIDIIQGK